MINDNEPLITQYISVPKEIKSLNCGAFTAGIVEAVLDSAGFVSCFKLACQSFCALNGKYYDANQNNYFDKI
jgi:hypothetical protein